MYSQQHQYQNTLSDILKSTQTDESFTNTYKKVIEEIEKEYRINLTIIEKVELKHMLMDTHNRFGKKGKPYDTQDEPETHMRWLARLGISPDAFDTFYGTEGFTEYIRRKREESIIELYGCNLRKR